MVVFPEALLSSIQSAQHAGAGSFLPHARQYPTYWLDEYREKSAIEILARPFRPAYEIISARWYSGRSRGK